MAGSRAFAESSRESKSVSALRVGLSTSLDCVAPLGKGYGHSRRGASCQKR
jgi:hypothetical protein